MMTQDEPFTRDIPYPSGLLEVKLEAKGLATDKALTDAWWCGLDIDQCRPHLYRVAKQTMTERQFEVFEPWLRGETQESIAVKLGVTPQVISKSLNGKTLPGGSWVNGSLVKLRVALIEDDAFLLELAKAKAVGFDVPSQAPASTEVRDWFRGLRNLSLHHFIPRCVLLMAHTLMDSKRETTYSALYEHLPPAVVTQGMPLLKTLGYVESDGVRIRILKTPLTEQR